MTSRVHSDFFVIQNLIYDPCRFSYSKLNADTESYKYGACSFILNKHNVRFRVAKTTPTKVGLFVTAWKRSKSGEVQPYDASDNIDLLVINTRQNHHFGQFVFPQSALLEKNIFSKNKISGKRGFRVYPPWVKTMNEQAQKTQKWQLEYFLGISTTTPINSIRAQELYSPR